MFQKLQTKTKVSKFTINLCICNLKSTIWSEHLFDLTPPPCRPRLSKLSATRVQSTTVSRSASAFVATPESPTKILKRGPNYGFSDGLAEGGGGGGETSSLSSSENSSSRRNSRSSKGDRDSVLIELSEPVSTKLYFSTFAAVSLCRVEGLAGSPCH